MKKITSFICLMFALLMIFTLPASASAPYQTYTYSINGTALHSPDAYTPDASITSADMGLDVPLNSPTDLETDSLGNVYIADRENNRIVVLDPYYKLKFTISTFVNEQGIDDSLLQPQGVFVTPDKTVDGEFVEGRIFVCDTNNGRIVTFTHEGEFLRIIPKPESQLFSESSIYKPVAVAVDRYDRMYVVSPTTYQGVVVMTDTGTFVGFVGAQATTLSAWEIILRRFMTEEQRKASDLILPTEFNNISINDDGFIYVTTNSIEESSVSSSIKSKSKDGKYAPVKMLNAAGDEIMRRNGFYPPSGEVDMAKATPTSTIFGVSNIVDVAVGPEATWSIIDQKRGKVFTYDFDGNLMFAFGDSGVQLGNINPNSLVAVTYQGDKMLLLDRRAPGFTVFKRTQYGNMLATALRHQNERLYDRSIDDWTEILKRNSNFDAAYIGIGNAKYGIGEYEEAITYYKAAYDTANYSTAYKEIRKEWISDYLILIPIIIIIICVACSKFLGYAKKVNKRVGVSGNVTTYGQELLYVCHTMFHPFDGYWDLKHAKRGSVRAGLTFLGITIIGFYYQSIGQGYIVNPQQTYSTFFGSAISVVLPVVLWVVGNWCLTTLFDGEGSIKDIFIATTYSLVPLPILMIPATIASNFVLAEEADIVSLVVTFAFIWAGLLLFFGMMVTHDYTIIKNLLTVIFSVVAMAFIIFIAVLFSTLLGKLVGFVANIITELQYR